MIYLFASASVRFSVVQEAAEKFAKRQSLPLYIQPLGLPHNEEANDANVALSKADERGIVYACQELPILRFTRLIRDGELKHTEIEVYNILGSFYQRIALNEGGEFTKKWLCGFFDARGEELF